MIVHPKIGQAVQVWYRREVAPGMPYHSRMGRVVTKGRGPGPRNHAVEIEGCVVMVPCGNVRPGPRTPTG